ncbi:MAG TPA: serine hydrolase domain-containing protein, partial [bacterium]
ASVSKSFAPVLTGLLVKDGVLSWDDRVTKYLPEFSLKNSSETNRLTIKHLLSHTSGLPAHTYTNLLDENAALGNIYDMLKGVGLIAPVGSTYSYQIIVYSLIGDIVRSATSKAYSQLVTERIFQPLGMFDASFGKETFAVFHNCAKPHIRNGFGWTTTEVKQGYYNVPPAAGVNASILDMARWLRAMMGGSPEIIPLDVIKQVTTPVIPTPQEKRKFRWRDHLKDAHYGLGWRIYDYGGTTIVYHGGWVEGFRAEVGFIPDQKIGIAVLINCETLAAALFLPTFFDMYLNFPVPDSIHASFD